jgi:phage terminase large subunit
MTVSIEKTLFKVGPVYHANASSLADIAVNQGGTDSGKTYAIIQLLLKIAVYDKAPEIDPIITTLSESVPNAKKGAYRVAESIINNNDQIRTKVKDWNKTDRTIIFESGWILEFVGATNEQNAKQGKRQYLFVNEANGLPWPIFWQMAKRTRIRTFIDYNPSTPFWAHEKLIGTVPAGNDLNATVQLIISDHRHNPFLDQKEHQG